MLGLLIRLLVNAIAIFLTAQFLAGVNVPDLYTAFIVAIVLGLINTFLKPILLLFTLPINILTLGLFTFIINAILILVVSNLVTGFEVTNLWWALAFAVILGIVNSVLLKIVE